MSWRCLSLFLSSYKNEQFVDPYSKLAYIYDDVMVHVDYKHWSRYIQEIVKRWKPHAKKILDISCGTGNLLLKLDSKKYQLFGFDFSYDMLKIAIKKSKLLKMPICLWQSNMISFRLKRTVDIIICLYDSINYLINETCWKKLLDCVYDGLSDDGIFIFDICTEKNSIKYFHNYSEKKRGNNYCYKRESKYDSQNRIHTNRFVIHFDSDKNTYVELHRQQIFLLSEVLNIIRTDSFQLLGFYDGFTFNLGSENSLRVHIVLKKK